VGKLWRAGKKPVKIFEKSIDPFFGSVMVFFPRKSGGDGAV
jgi:hypothetical protein